MKTRRSVRYDTLHGRLESGTWRTLVADPSPTRGCYCWRPPTNVYRTENGGLVQVEVAGLSSGHFEVSFGDGTLTVAGVRRGPATGVPMTCQQMEIASGSFRTVVPVSWAVDAAGIRVDYRDGFLTVLLPCSRPTSA